MEYSTIKVSVDEKTRIMTLMLSRPKQKNAWTNRMNNEIEDALEYASKNENVRVVIITGDPKAGGVFCAGADLSGGSESFGDSPSDSSNKSSSSLSSSSSSNKLSTDALSRSAITSRVRSGRSSFRDGGGIAGLAAINCTKPTIAAINGSAVGVGITFPCSCDIRICVENAKISFAFVKRGLACETISSWTLPRLIGLGKAQELVLTGRMFEAKDAPNGLFNYILPTSDDVLKKANEIALEISNNCSAISVALSRSMLIRNQLISPEEAHLIESKAIHHLSNSDEVREGVSAFLEKRKVNFKGRAFEDLPDFYPFWNGLVTKSKL